MRLQYITTLLEIATAGFFRSRTEASAPETTIYDDSSQESSSLVTSDWSSDSSLEAATGAGFADILLKAAVLLALWERVAVMLGVVGTLLTDAAGKLTSPSVSLSSLEDGARLALLLEGAGGRTDRAAGVGGTA